MRRTISQSGFTLIEMMLSVGIIALLTGISLPVFASFSARNDLAVTAQKTADVTRRAVTYSKGAAYDSGWGVYVQSGSVTLYKGASYAARDTTYDESFTVPGTVAVSAATDTAFSKLQAQPAAATSVTFTNATGSSRTVAVNAEGAVSY